MMNCQAFFHTNFVMMKKGIKKRPGSRSRRPTTRTRKKLLTEPMNAWKVFYLSPTFPVTSPAHRYRRMIRRFLNTSIPMLTAHVMCASKHSTANSRQLTTTRIITTSFQRPQPPSERMRVEVAQRIIITKKRISSAFALRLPNLLLHAY